MPVGVGDRVAQATRGDHVVSAPRIDPTANSPHVSLSTRRGFDHVAFHDGSGVGDAFGLGRGESAGQTVIGSTWAGRSVVGSTSAARSALVDVVAVAARADVARADRAARRTAGRAAGPTATTRSARATKTARRRRGHPHAQQVRAVLVLVVVIVGIDRSRRPRPGRAPRRACVRRRRPSRGSANRHGTPRRAARRAGPRRGRARRSRASAVVRAASGTPRRSSSPRRSPRRSARTATWTFSRATDTTRPPSRACRKNVRLPGFADRAGDEALGRIEDVAASRHVRNLYRFRRPAAAGRPSGDVELDGVPAAGPVGRRRGRAAPPGPRRCHRSRGRRIVCRPGVASQAATHWTQVASEIGVDRVASCQVPSMRDLDLARCRGRVPRRSRRSAPGPAVTDRRAACRSGTGSGSAPPWPSRAAPSTPSKASSVVSSSSASHFVAET